MGSLQREDEWGGTWPACAAPRTAELFLVMAASHKQRVEQGDFVGAHLQAVTCRPWRPWRPGARGCLSPKCSVPHGSWHVGVWEQHTPGTACQGLPLATSVLVTATGGAKEEHSAVDFQARQLLLPAGWERKAAAASKALLARDREGRGEPH